MLNLTVMQYKTCRHCGEHKTPIWVTKCFECHESDWQPKDPPTPPRVPKKGVSNDTKV